MAKRNKKGGWTGTAAGAGAVKSGGGPQVEKNFDELKKYDAKHTPMQRGIRILLFVLVCVLAGSLIFQATPKNMAEYWGVADQWESVSKVEITVFGESGDEDGIATELTGEAELEAFFTALDESKLKRLWDDIKLGRGPKETKVPAFTSEIRIYLEGSDSPAFEAGFVRNHVYFLYMPTYLWYLEDTAPLMEYLN